MFTKSVGAANLKFSLDKQQAMRQLEQQIGSVVVKCAADGVLHSSRTQALVYEACTNTASRLSDQKLTYDLEALNKAGKTIAEYMEWLDSRQQELLIQDFGEYIERLIKEKPYLSNVKSMVKREINTILSRAKTKGQVAALEQVTACGAVLKSSPKVHQGVKTMGSKKKVQVFISSTYIDMKEERQAAVQAILNAGHMPAGMELFAAGNESQWETIQRWINESDAFMLILGGRYGSVEPISQKSYIELEYHYALSIGKPLFAVVASEKALQEKFAKLGSQAVESENTLKYESFKKLVLSRICKHFDDHKDIREAVHQTLGAFLEKYEFAGWVSGKDLNALEDVLAENVKLKEELNSMSQDEQNLITLESLGRNLEIDIRSKNSIIFDLNTSVPNVNVWLRFTNKNPLNIVVDRVVVDLWIGQPLLEGAIFNKIELKPLETNNSVRFNSTLNEHQKSYLLSRIEAVGTENLVSLNRLIVYCQSKLGLFERSFPITDITPKINR